MVNRFSIENKLIEAIINSKEARKYIFDRLDKKYFTYEKLIYEKLNELYKVNEEVRKEYVISKLGDIEIELTKLESYKRDININIYDVEKNVKELKDLYKEQRLTELSKQIKNRVEKKDDFQDIIFDIKECLNDFDEELYNRDYYIKNKKSLSVNKSKFAKWIKEKSLIVTENGTNYQYNNGVYEILNDEKLKQLIYENLSGEFKSNVSIIENTYKLINLEPNSINTEKLDLSSNINFKNCIYSIKDNKIINHSPTIQSTIQINSNYNNGAKCIKFIEWLNNRLDQDDISTIQEMIGYLMIANVEAQKFFIITGEGCTGKSTLIKVIQNILGEKNISSIDISNLNERFLKAELYNKLTNIYDDLPNYTSISNNIRPLVTGDRLIAEKKCRDPFEFNNFARLVFTCNRLPETNDYTSAFFRRCILIEMNNIINSQDIKTNFEKVLLEEKEGIVNWAVQGLQRLINNDFKFTISQNSKKILEKYKEDSDTLKIFIDEKCKVGENCLVPISKFKTEYVKYCSEIKSTSIKQHEIKRQLLDRGYLIKKIKNIHTIVGLSI